MTRIWPGEVCVRRRWPSTSTYSVSHRSRAGWSGGMLSIWKLRSVVLDLRALVDDEAELAEDLGDPPDRLDDRVQATRGGSAGPAS